MGALYSYMGLKDSENKEGNVEMNGQESNEKYISKTPETLINEFIHSIKVIRSTNDLQKYHKWKESIDMLESDVIFKSVGLIEIVLEKVDELNEVFNSLSSGHKIILLTFTKLIEKIDEKI